MLKAHQTQWEAKQTLPSQSSPAISLPSLSFPSLTLLFPLADGAFGSAGPCSAQPLELRYIQRSSKAAIRRKSMSCKQRCAAASLKQARSAGCRYNYPTWTKGAGASAWCFGSGHSLLL